MSDETKPVPVAAIYRWNDDGTCAVEPLYSNARGTMTCVGYQILDAESAQVCRVHCDGCAEAASLRDRVDELRTELESHVNADAAWKIQVGDLRTRLATAESQALASRAERDELRGLVDQVGDFVATAADEAEDDDQAGRMPRVQPLERALKSIGKLVGAWLRAHPAAIPEGTPGEGKGRL